MSLNNSHRRRTPIPHLKYMIGKYFTAETIREILNSLLLCETGSKLELVGRLQNSLTQEATSRTAAWLVEAIALRMNIDVLNCDPSSVTGLKPPPPIINPTMNQIVYLKNEQYLCKWTEIIDLAVVPLSERPYSKVHLRFKVEPGYGDRLASTNNKSDLSIILRCCVIVDGQMHLPQRDDYPSTLFLYIGTENCTKALPRVVASSLFDEVKLASIPTTLNDYLSNDIIEGRVEAELSMLFRSNNEVKSNKRYAMAVILGEKRSVQEVLNEIISRPKKSIEDFKVELNNYMGGDGGMLLEKVTISLASSLTATRIKVPIRGTNCCHLLIDDLEEYLENNEFTEKWECKICKQPMRPDDIFIDEFYSDLLAKNETAMEVDLSKDGQITVTICQDELPCENLSDSDDGYQNERMLFNNGLKNEVIIIDDSWEDISEDSWEDSSEDSSDDGLGNSSDDGLGNSSEDSSEDEAAFTDDISSNDFDDVHSANWVSNDGNSFNHHLNTQTPFVPPSPMLVGSSISPASFSSQSVRYCNSALQLSIQTTTELNTESVDSGRRFVNKKPNGNAEEIECFTLIDTSDDENNKLPLPKKSSKKLSTADIISSPNVFMRNGADKSNFNDSVSINHPTDVVPIVSLPSMQHLLSSMGSLNIEPLTASHGLISSVPVETEDNETDFIET